VGRGSSSSFSSGGPGFTIDLDGLDLELKEGRERNGVGREVQKRFDEIREEKGRTHVGVVVVGAVGDVGGVAGGCSGEGWARFGEGGGGWERRGEKEKRTMMRMLLWR